VKQKKKKVGTESKQDQDDIEDDEEIYDDINLQPVAPKITEKLVSEKTPEKVVQETTVTATQLEEQDPAKRLKNLTKKLRQIEELKSQQSQGKVLDAAQLQKIQSEQQLSAEIAALEKTLGAKKT